MSVDHVAAVVEHLEKALEILTDGFGFEILEVKDYPEINVRTAFVGAGNTKIELIQPTGPGRYLETLKAGGKGMNHIAIQVDNMQATLTKLRSLGVTSKDEKPRHARGGAFVDLNDETTVGIKLQLFEIDKQKMTL